MVMDHYLPTDDIERYSEREIRALLAAHHIDFSSWGLRGSKSIEELLVEIHSGEATLMEIDGVLVRRVDGVSVDVFAEIEGEVRRLVEDRQIFASDGTVRRRNLSTSLGEKKKAGESALPAMVRALKEELGLDVDEAHITVGEESRATAPSKAYPGLMTDRGMTRGVVVLPSELYVPEGYTERQLTKEIYFTWHQL